MINGMISAFKEVLIHFEFMGDMVISSFDARSMIRKMAMMAPPTPSPIGIVIETALDAAVVVVVAVVVTVVITVESIFPRQLIKLILFIIIPMQETQVIMTIKNDTSFGEGRDPMASLSGSITMGPV